jgi:hypothetical protein
MVPSLVMLLVEISIALALVLYVQKLNKAVPR